ncbi:MAG: nucleotide exchange factor GrpE [Bacillota bacterium]|nr:nucleotide exchange factor GrpE [Bacillota bacterium]
MSESKQTMTDEQQQQTEQPAEETKAAISPEQIIAALQTENDELIAELNKRQQEDGEAEQRFLRLQADFDNYRRRSAAERELQTQTAAAALIEQLLPVLDNFERALAAMTGEADKAGVELIRKQLLAVLSAAGMSEIEAAGAEFDPQFHQAVAQLPAELEEERGKVAMVLQKGYMLHDKLLRAAVVQVYN